MIKTNRIISMKTPAITWMLALALTGMCPGQQSELQRKYDEELARSMKRAVETYPDLAKADSLLRKKALVIEKAFNVAGDPRYYYSEMPMIVAEIAAKELKINPVAAASTSPTIMPAPVMLRLTTAPWEPPKSFPVLGPDGKVAYGIQTGPETISEFKPLRGDAYKSVIISLIEPDGLRIMHESGATKIPIEKLTDGQRLKYGLTMEGAAQYRKQVADGTAAYYAKQRLAAIQAKADEEVAAEIERERQEQIRANPPREVQAPVWERYVTNSVARANNRDKVADEIRRQDGDAAADQFLTDERLKDLEEAKEKGGAVAIQPPLPRYLEGGKLQRKGDRITLTTDPTNGYKVRGNKLYSLRSGAPTHTRSGNIWVPLNKSQSQIWDPE